MRYTIDELRDKLIETVKGARHLHYDRTVDLAKHYKRIMTGDDQDELIVSYKIRETDEQKEQRVRITNSRTQYVGNKVMSVFDEVKRVDNVVNEISWKDKKDSNDKLLKLNSRLDVFQARMSLKKYLYEAVKHFQFYDPNAFILVEMRKDEDEEIFTYPLEVTSEQAVNYEYKDGSLEYLIARHPHTIKETGNKEDAQNKGSRYLLYAPDVALDLKQLGSKDILEEDYEEIILDEESEKEKRFAFKLYETMSQVNPAIRVGYIKDVETNRETFVSPLEPAMKVITDLINTKSEYDLSKALHGFIQKYAYAMTCNFNEINEDHRVFCQNGQLNTGGTCQQCKGHGLILHKTVQDVVLIKAPDGKEEHIPLDQMVHYVQIPDYIIERQKQDLKDLENDVSLAIFNVNVFDRSEVAMTATEKRLNLRSIYNILADYGDQWSQIYKHCVKLTAIHTLLADDISIVHQFPNDFNMESVEELIQQRKMAKDASLPAHIVDTIDLKILNKQSQDDPVKVSWQKVIEQHRPFREKTPDVLMFILSLLPESDPKRVLFINFEDIFEQIKQSDPDFYKRPFDARKKILDEMILDITGEEKSPGSFRDQLTGDKADIEAEAKAKLKGTVGGVQGLIQINAAVAEGTMTEAAAEKILVEIYGFTPELAASLIDPPPIGKRKQEAAAQKGQSTE